MDIDEKNKIHIYHLFSPFSQTRIFSLADFKSFQMRLLSLRKGCPESLPNHIPLSYLEGMERMIETSDYLVVDPAKERTVRVDRSINEDWCSPFLAYFHTLNWSAIPFMPEERKLWSGGQGYRHLSEVSSDITRFITSSGVAPSSFRILNTPYDNESGDSYCTIETLDTFLRNSGYARAFPLNPVELRLIREEISKGFVGDKPDCKDFICKD